MKLTDGYSAPVDLKLIVDGEVLDVAQTGPTSLILREPHIVPATPAVLVIHAGASRDEYDIVLQANGPEPSKEVFYW